MQKKKKGRKPKQNQSRFGQYYLFCKTSAESKQAAKCIELNDTKFNETIQHIFKDD